MNGRQVMERTEPASAPVARTKKGRRKFDKKTAHRFTLMHRSQLDPLYDEEGASKLVLHPQNERTAEGTVYAELRHAQDREQEQREAAAAATADASSGTKHLSAVDEMGMPHDGYDYRQHIRPMGGGTFVGVDGKTRSASDGSFTSRDGSPEPPTSEVLPLLPAPAPPSPSSA